MARKTGRRARLLSKEQGVRVAWKLKGRMWAFHHSINWSRGGNDSQGQFDLTEYLYSLLGTVALTGTDRRESCTYERQTPRDITRDPGWKYGFRLLCRESIPKQAQSEGDGASFLIGPSSSWLWLVSLSNHGVNVPCFLSSTYYV